MVKYLAAAIGSCVHVAGVLAFLAHAENEGYDTVFLGPAIPVDELIESVKKHDPDVVGVSYRLTTESAAKLLTELKKEVFRHGLENKRWLLGCTAPTKPIAEKLDFFEEIFTGFSTDEDVLACIRGRSKMCVEEKHPGDLVTRLVVKSPIPILRHHFGLPSMEATLDGIVKISEASVLDVISIGPDQNAQESFFRPREMSPTLEGDGGVPIRTREDLQILFEASKRGNHPLLRCYSGTRDLLKWAGMLKDTINNAWCATPLTWYSELDGRSKRPLKEAVKENLANHRWHAEHNIPVEVNESHHWSLRSAHDTIAVAMAYISARAAKALGVQTYVAQYMLNTPLNTSPRMDLAKMLAEIKLIESLHDHSFTTLREVRPGLFSYPPDSDMGKGQLASSVYTGMMLKPNIVHVVAYCEADHAANAEDVIESCKIARRVIRDTLLGLPDPLQDAEIRRRKEELVREAKLLVDTIANIDSRDSPDPFVQPHTYVRAVETGLLDAPHLRNNSTARGQLKTKMIGGACRAVDAASNQPISEFARLQGLGFMQENHRMTLVS